MNDFVTISTYDDYLTANFDKQKLEEQGINCYLADENIVTAKWILKNALGGIKLRVPEQQADEALAVLNSKTEEIAVDFRLDAKADDINCPYCGSNNTGTEKYSKSIAGWTWLILGFPVTATPIKQHRCFYCGHKWET
jgi:DNA-directed RNA polymerase subunit RPC12/RpoP